MSKKETTMFPDIIKSIDFERIPQELIDKCLSMSNGITLQPTFYLSWALDKLGMVGAIPSSLLKPIISGKVIAGSAVTYRKIPNRTMPVEGWRLKETEPKGEKKAVHGHEYDFVKPGDVLVIEGAGRSDVSSFGSGSAWSAKNAGIVGTIVDGGIIHVASMRKLDYPIWTRGITPITGVQRIKTVEINGQIACAGVPVRPGDLVCADDSGIVVVPSDKAQEIVNMAKDSADARARMYKAYSTGKSQEEVRRLKEEYYGIGKNKK